MNSHWIASDGREMDVRSSAFSRLVELGAAYDASPAFPRSSLTVLASLGLGRRYAPMSCGGHTFANEEDQAIDLFNVLRWTGRADLSVGRLFEGHVNALKLIDWYGSDYHLSHLRESLAAGKFYGVWATEHQPGTTVQTRDGMIDLEGVKTFASGAGSIDHALVTAQPPEGKTQLIRVPGDIADRADCASWRVRGMRATMSGDYSLNGMRLDPHACLGAQGDYDREPRFTAGAWRFLAVQLGGIEGLLGAIKRSLPEKARSDPLQRLKFAECVVASRTAHYWVAEASRKAAREDIDSPAFVQMARGVVERAGLDVVERAARLIGTRSAFDGERVDKISRDLALYLRQAGPDHARDQAAIAWLQRNAGDDGGDTW